MGSYVSQENLNTDILRIHVIGQNRRYALITKILKLLKVLIYWKSFNLFEPEIFCYQLHIGFGSIAVQG